MDLMDLKVDKRYRLRNGLTVIITGFYYDNKTCRRYADGEIYAADSNFCDDRWNDDGSYIRWMEWCGMDILEEMPEE